MADFAEHLERWVAEARIDEAALGRARERWLREVAEQEATLAGVLTDLAERGAPVTVHLRGGRRHHGTVVGVGADFIAVGPTASAPGAEVLVAVHAITGVQTGPNATIGDRALGTELHLSDVLSELATDRERVAIVSDGEVVVGELRSVGIDVAVLRTESDAPSVRYLSLRAIDEVTLGSTLPR